MFERIAAAGAVLALALSCTDAAAAAHASARLSDLRIQLYSIGSTSPSVTFTVGDGSTASTTTASTTPGLSSEGHSGGGAAFAAVQCASPDSAALGSFAQIVGDAFNGGATMLASAFAVANQSQAEGSASLADGNSYAKFMLSADTVMVITAVADLESAADAGRSGDFALGSIDLELAGSEGDSSQSSAAHSLALSGGLAGASESRHMLLSISFTNAFDHAISGLFFAGVDATAVSSVPEPASGALALAGVAFVLAGRRRARARQA